MQDEINFESSCDSKRVRERNSWIYSLLNSKNEHLTYNKFMKS